MEISAGFRAHDRNGDTLALNPPSRVTYNDQEMPRRDAFRLGATYIADEKSYQPPNKFVFTNTKGKTFTNAINLEPIAFAASSLQLKKDSKNVIPVTRIVKDEDTKTVLSIHEPSHKEFSSEVHSSRGVAGFRSSVYFDDLKQAIISVTARLSDLNNKDTFVEWRTASVAPLIICNRESSQSCFLFSCSLRHVLHRLRCVPQI